MRKTRFSEEQIINLLKGVEAGQRVADACRAHGISEQTYHRWKAKYGGLDVNEARRLKALNEQIKAADKRLEEIAGGDEMVRRLCSVPGVGPVVATTFASALDEASRFLGAKHVRSYLGLVPREYSSGERQHRGRISKAGSVRARSLLVEAAWAVLRWKTERTKSLHEWWARIAQRRGKPTAVVALARKLAGIMFAVWRDGTQSDPLLLRSGGATASPAAT